ncbi:hypothetical protein CHS0354_004877 [Potamilus streckersoni]|uniref:WD repeat-containing protein 86 n=1 Tax=Potamilus streckersoni TaxID=2493646 RepID=A0AAE0SI63_9BIVA|nr:hypothetical protein CHS0354_004877 [Potamilus streckersoni]
MLTMGCGASKEGTGKKKSYLLETLTGHDSGINCMALSEDGSVLATGSEDKTARLWSTKTASCECIGILRGHEEYLNCILIEDCFVLTGSADKTVRKWDVATCECLVIMRGHTSVIYRMICTGDFVFTSSYDRTARCWDFDTGECIRVFRGHKRGVYPLIFIPGDDDDVHEGNLDTLDGSKDLLITGSADFTARTWNFETGQCIKVFKGHTGAITCMSTDSIGRTLFTGSTDQTIRSWNIVNGEQLKLFSGHQGSVICMVVVNKILYSGSSDHTGRAWVTEFGDCTRIYKGHKHTISVIKVKDGLVFSGSGDSGALCYAAKSGSLKREFKGHEGAINALQVVDGKLFTGSYDGSVKVWDATGITDDTTFSKDEGKNKNKENDVDRIDKHLEKVDKNQNGIANGNVNKIMID